MPNSKRKLTFKDLAPGDLFRFEASTEVYMKLNQPISSDDAAINNDREDLSGDDPALQDGLFYAVRSDGLPAPEFRLDDDSKRQWARPVVKLEWPWEK